MNYHRTLAVLGLCLGLEACFGTESKTSPIQPPKAPQTYSPPNDTVAVNIDGIQVQVKGCASQGCSITINDKLYHFRGEVPAIKLNEFDAPSLEGKLVPPEEEIQPRIGFHNFARGEYVVSLEGDICGKSGACQPKRDFPEIKGVIVGSTPRKPEVRFAVYFRDGKEYFGRYNLPN